MFNDPNNACISLYSYTLNWVLFLGLPLWMNTTHTRSRKPQKIKNHKCPKIYRCWSGVLFRKTVLKMVCLPIRYIQMSKPEGKDGREKIHSNNKWFRTDFYVHRWSFNVRIEWKHVIRFAVIINSFAGSACSCCWCHVNTRIRFAILLDISKRKSNYCFNNNKSLIDFPFSSFPLFYLLHFVLGSEAIFMIHHMKQLLMKNLQTHSTNSWNSVISYFLSYWWFTSCGWTIKLQCYKLSWTWAQFFSREKGRKEEKNQFTPGFNITCSCVECNETGQCTELT